MGIDYKGNQGLNGIKTNNRYKTAEEYINSGSYIKSHLLKQKLIKDGIKIEKCELCGLISWHNVKLPLELHHKDGNHYNNDISNLQILCPNCHSIQPGNSGSNAGRYNKIKYIGTQNDADMMEMEDIAELDSAG